MEERFGSDLKKIGHESLTDEELSRIKKLKTKELEIVNGGQGSGDVEGHEFRGNQYSGLSTKTYQMTDSIKMSSRQKLSESIVERFPPKTEWKDPRAYEIAEIAAHSFSSNGTQLIAAEDKDNKIQGLVSFYPDPDGVNITYIASTGNVRHTGTDLLKKAIDSNPGKDVNLYADPGAKTYYAHLGMHMVDDGGEGRGATFHWSADEAKKFSSIPKETMNIVSRLLSMITKKMVHGGEGSGEHEGHEFRGNQYDGNNKKDQLSTPGTQWKTNDADKILGTMTSGEVFMCYENAAHEYMTQRRTGKDVKYVGGKLYVYAPEDDLSKPLGRFGYIDHYWVEDDKGHIFDPTPVVYDPDLIGEKSPNRLPEKVVTHALYIKEFETSNDKIISEVKKHPIIEEWGMFIREDPKTTKLTDMKSVMEVSDM